MAGIEVVWNGKDEIALRIKNPGNSDFDIPLPAAWAKVTGRALIAAAAISESNNPNLPAGTVVDDVPLPVMRYVTGIHKTNGEPVLRLTVAGDLTMSFQMPADTAEACGKALQEVGEKARPQGLPS